MTTTTHTPTPWAYKMNSTGTRYGIGPEHREFVVLTQKTHGPAADNAAFIVTACNAHDELVAALRKIDDTAKSHPYAVNSCGDIARAALAKVAP